MATVTLVMAWGPGLPEGSPGHRYEMSVTLDPQGHIDPAAWQADPNPWPARRIWPAEPERHGDVQYDPEYGWSLRFFGGAAQAPDVPLQDVLQPSGPMRPGEYVGIREADGEDYGYRIVSVT
ncbi:hypothetical protein M0638_11800 [Roseomonas sp. NAR14]|uniref:Uncharacterized protein n=1 Tax=Roseomonas acroporae TaxID=2937791 RepID=A0A9X2BTW5_9PROT|nr:hypothetical protein [Roseomonas acroporae]MCK8785068.1 hypothetical protein [Roseomonas acroporae]